MKAHVSFLSKTHENETRKGCMEEKRIKVLKKKFNMSYM